MLRLITTTITLILLAACGDSTGPGGGGGGATLSGTVRVAGQTVTVAGATVSVGTLKATSDENGRFELTSVPVDSATVRAERPGYEPAEATITLSAGANTHDFVLTAKEIYLLGNTAVLVPSGTAAIGGAIIVVGSNGTRGFITGEPIHGSDNPDLEQSLQEWAASVRSLARSRHVALLGANDNPSNSAASDEAFFAALRTVAASSGHAELAEAPVLGMSLSETEMGGLVSRHPDRAIGLLARVPPGAASLVAVEALAVPTFVMQAGLDNPSLNHAVQAAFAANRAHGGLWALAVEPDVRHEQASARGNAAATGWISRVLDLRLPSTPGDQLITLGEQSGWLGNQSTLSIAPWADYVGNRATASWLLNEATAGSWKLLGAPPGSGGGGGE
ncbi:MAG TPA: carboxypeptidase regulatory-like domain-containing protein [Gemmatimonadales bacterium]|nr:carboxypeptidase regulatory-like domain-containing protein [Gemmatimonadales bacterium]